MKGNNRKIKVLKGFYKEGEANLISVDATRSLLEISADLRLVPRVPARIRTQVGEDDGHDRGRSVEGEQAVGDGKQGREEAEVGVHRVGKVVRGRGRRGPNLSLHFVLGVNESLSDN